MTFTTLTFLIFLACFFALYWILGHPRWQNLLIVAASYAFYGWWDWRFCGLMLISTGLDYGVALGLQATSSATRRKWILGISLAGNLGLLGFFKYFNFFADSFVQMLGVFGWKVTPVTLHVVLPVGISFYTFQTMSYSLDVYRDRIRPTKQWLEYMAYVSFFPQLVAGPIERAAHFLPQFFARRVFQYDRAVDGCRQILWGFFKKMVVADQIAPLVDVAFGNPAAHTGAQLAAASLLFSFQIYCDFSAYSDIAIGLARLFGFDLMRNFATPYFSQNLVEFWRRWHISLMSWFKDYVYVSLGGNRVGQWKSARNVMAVFLLSGLWHGPSWTFLLWGGLHGFLTLLTKRLCPDRSLEAKEIPGGSGWIPSWKIGLKMLITFLLVTVGWILFRAQSLSDATLILRRIVGDIFHLESLFLAWTWLANHSASLGFLLALGVVLVLEWIQRDQPHPLRMARWPWPLRWFTYFALTAWILLEGTMTTGEFIYFQF